MRRIADIIFDYLADCGVTRVFTVSGGGAIFLDDALAQSDRIAYTCCHHEQAVTIATETYARVKGGFGVALVTSGPGGTNAITGAVCCWLDSVPQLVISGQVFKDQTIGDSGLRQMGVQEINIIDLVRPITKYAVMVTEAHMTRYHIQKAIHIATTGRYGPVWVDIPGDIQNAVIDEADLQLFDPAEIQPVKYDDDLDEKVAAVAALLNSAKRPLLHIGQGVAFAGALDDFMALVERYDLPFVTARHATQYVNWDHPLYIGQPGTFPQRGPNFAVQNADLYIAIGTRLSLPQTGYASKDYARNATKVMVDIDTAELYKKTLDFEYKIHSDAKVFITALRQLLDDSCQCEPVWLDHCRNWKKKYPIVLPEYKEQITPINSYYFVDVLSDLLTPSDILVTDMGLAYQGTLPAFRVKKGQKFFTNSGLAPMGWGLPAAIGACIANDNKRVICINGEGGIQMNIQELATIMENRLPIKLFIYDNGGYMTIRQTQEISFEGRLMGCGETSGVSFPDFAKIAEAHRIHYARLDSQVNLKEEVAAIIDSDGPVFCELVLDPRQMQIPKAIQKKLPDGTFIRPVFEDLFPFLPTEEMKENMEIDWESLTAPAHKG